MNSSIFSDTLIFFRNTIDYVIYFMQTGSLFHWSNDNLICLFVWKINFGLHFISVNKKNRSVWRKPFPHFWIPYSQIITCKIILWFLQSLLFDTKFNAQSFVTKFVRIIICFFCNIIYMFMRIATKSVINEIFATIWIYKKWRLFSLLNCLHYPSASINMHHDLIKHKDD